MADDELLIPIDKALWPKGIVRGLTSTLRELGDKHGNLVIVPQQTKGNIMVKGAKDKIEEAKPALRKIVEEHFPDADIPEELMPSQSNAHVVTQQAAPSQWQSSTASIAEVNAGGHTCGAGPKIPRPRAVSTDLLWQCIRKHSSFSRRPVRELRPFSAEPGNIMSFHALKYSGLVSNEVLDVRPSKKGSKEAVNLMQSHPKASRQQRAQRYIRTGLSKSPKRGLLRLSSKLDWRFYRRGLSGLATHKFLKVLRSFKKTRVTIRSRRQNK